MWPARTVEFLPRMSVMCRFTENITLRIQNILSRRGMMIIFPRIGICDYFTLRMNDIASSRGREREKKIYCILRMHDSV